MIAILQVDALQVLFELYRQPDNSGLTTANLLNFIQQVICQRSIRIILQLGMKDLSAQ